MKIDLEKIKRLPPDVRKLIFSMPKKRKRLVSEMTS
jgi:hypothetical protein